MTRAYTFDDIVTVLNQIAPYDWTRFFQKRVYDIPPRAPLGGIEQGGWELVYDSNRNEVDQDPLDDLIYSIGMTVHQTDKEGMIVDVIPGGAAADAGIAPGMKLVAVNGQPWSPEILLAALKSPGTPPRLELLVENAGHPRTFVLNYGDGPHYPHLKRNPSRSDLLEEIIKPHALIPAPAQ